MLRVLSACALLLPVAHGECSDSKVQLGSTPAGAIVCKKVLDREECFGKTPLLADVGSQSASSTKVIVRKFGYRAREIYIEPGAQQMSVTLEKRDLLYDPGKQADSRLRRVQQEVNDRLSKVIYRAEFQAERYLDLVGQRTIYKDGEGLVLAFPVLVNSADALRRLKQAGRARNTQARHAAAVEVLADIGVFEVFEAVMAAVWTLPVDKIAFNVLYSKSVAVLDFDQIEHLNRRYVGTHYTGYGDTRQRVDTYEIYTTRQDVTVVKDKTLSVDYTFVVGKSIGSGKFVDLLDKIDVVTNDTPKNQYQKVQGLARR
jgi:hypothetical protein